jgi:hypothetical protein
MNIVYAVLGLVLGLSAFAFRDPAAVPVFGLAFGLAAVLRESRGLKRRGVLALACVGCLISLVGSILAILVRNR